MFFEFELLRLNLVICLLLNRLDLLLPLFLGALHFNLVELFSLDHLLLVILDLLRELLDLRVNFLVQNNDVLLFLGQLAL